MFNLYGKTDLKIQEDVQNELKWDPSVTSDEIMVTANAGVVTLRGNVPHYFDKITAVEAAQRVGGVRAIADEIKVELMGSYERSDEDIARAAIGALEWSYVIPQGVKVTVENGWVTLKGETEWDYERVAAKDAVSKLMGVRGVTNNISILSETVRPPDIKMRIEEALKRSAESEGRKINVVVDGCHVTLSGELDSISEIEDAKLAAWNAPGVVRVENNLHLAH